MSGFVGADTERLDKFGVACVARGNRISALVSDLDPRVLDEATWVGEDADQWRRSWRSLSGRMQELAALLRIAGHEARDQSEQQTTKSGSGGLGGGSGGGVPGGGFAGNPGAGNRSGGPGTDTGRAGESGSAPAGDRGAWSLADLVGLGGLLSGLNGQFRSFLTDAVSPDVLAPIGDLLAESLQASSPFEAMLTAGSLLEALESTLAAGVMDSMLSGDRLGAMLGLAQVDLVDAVQNLLMLSTIAELASAAQGQSALTTSLSAALGDAEGALPEPAAAAAGFSEALGGSTQDAGAAAGGGTAALFRSDRRARRIRRRGDRGHDGGPQLRRIHARRPVPRSPGGLRADGDPPRRRGLTNGRAPPMVKPASAS